jgi:hypothetical protein
MTGIRPCDHGQTPRMWSWGMAFDSFTTFEVWHSNMHTCVRDICWQVMIDSWSSLAVGNVDTGVWWANISSNNRHICDVQITSTRAVRLSDGVPVWLRIRESVLLTETSSHVVLCRRALFLWFVNIITESCAVPHYYYYLFILGFNQKTNQLTEWPMSPSSIVCCIL